MNFPFTVDNREPNNVWMIGKENYNKEVAISQWMKLYEEITRHALIYILPSEGNFQDLVYTANIGVYLPSEDIILISNFKSPPRIGEKFVGRKFLSSLGYKIIETPFHFEGMADLHYIRDNCYIGGEGIRTDIKTYEHLMDNYDMNIIPVEMVDEKLYHFDCLFSRIDPFNALLSVKSVSKKCLKRIEKIVNVIDVPAKYIYDGWTNVLIVGQKIFHAPPKNVSQEDFCNFMINLGLEPVLLNLEEYEKGGGDLSCLFCKLNKACYD